MQNAHNAHNAHNISNDYSADDDTGDIDDETDTMRGVVKDFIWYGYHSAAAIDDFIDACAAQGDAFDLPRIKAYARAEMARKRAAEAQWPAPTDCDRLDHAFAHLIGQGFCALQWPGDTLDDGLNAVFKVVNGDDVPYERYTTGFCFFHSQDMDHALNGEGMSVAFGHVDPESDEDDARMGRLVFEALEWAGLKPEWNGSADRRIFLPTLRWQRRSPD